MDDKDSENKGIICEHLNEVKLYTYIKDEAPITPMSVIEV